MLPLSPEPMRSSSGNSVESVEQPWVKKEHMMSRRNRFALVLCAALVSL